MTRTSTLYHWVKRIQRRGNDGYEILVPTLCLIVLGLLIVHSASADLANQRFGYGYLYTERHILSCCLGLGVMLLARRIPLTVYFKVARPFLLMSFILLALQHIPRLGPTRRIVPKSLHSVWLSFQPSEVAAFSIVLYMAYSMYKKGAKMASFSKGVLPYLLLVTAVIWLILFQPKLKACLLGAANGIQRPDYGTAMIIGSLVVILLFVGGVKRLHLFSGIVFVSVPFILRLWLVWEEYQLNRMVNVVYFRHEPTGFDAVEPSLAFSTALFGVGLGNAENKLWYLGSQYTNSVLSAVSEQLGLVGVVGIILIFGALITRGIQVAVDVDNSYTRYLAVGLTSFIGLRVLVHVGVCISLLPQTFAVNLPLISYGRSSLVLTLLSIGILLNISSRTRLSSG